MSDSPLSSCFRVVQFRHFLSLGLLFLGCWLEQPEDGQPEIDPATFILGTVEDYYQHSRTASWLEWKATGTMVSSSSIPRLFAAPYFENTGARTYDVEMYKKWMTKRPGSVCLRRHLAVVLR